MAAKKTGGTAGRLKAKNQAQAAAMKAAKVERNVARCPVCNHIVGIRTFYNHITTCKG